MWQAQALAAAGPQKYASRGPAARSDSAVARPCIAYEMPAMRPAYARAATPDTLRLLHLDGLSFLHRPRPPPRGAEVPGRPGQSCQ